MWITRRSRIARARMVGAVADSAAGSDLALGDSLNPQGTAKLATTLNTVVALSMENDRLIGDPQPRRSFAQIASNTGCEVAGRAN